jgi:hypothetical protein
VFIDYKRVFDSLNRECIWKELKARGLPSKFLHLINESYNSFSCRIYHNGHLSEPFLPSRIRQGCLLSPALFLFILDRILRRVMNDKMRGIVWKWMNSLEYLGYADDVCLLSHKYDHKQSKLIDLCR